MSRFNLQFFINNRWQLLIVVLAFPAFLVNLDVEPLIGDEGIRGLVAAEMNITGDYVTPRLGGEFYFNKPPLYNWILLPFSKLMGFSIFMLRFPTLIFLLIFTVVIYLTSRQHIGKKAAFFASLMFLTCGRILIYDSMRGLIDVLFSLIIYLMFYAIWYFSNKENYRKMFISAYLLAAIAFMLKGLPAIVFIGISLVAYLSVIKEFKRLFTWNHFIGIFCFLFPLGVYYYVYYQTNPEQILTLLEAIVHESTKKSVVGMGIGASLLHIVTFPFEFVYYFFPWTLLVIYLLKKESWKIIRSNHFFRFLSIIFISNIVVYWISPDTFARYLFMFLPSVFIPLAHIHLHNEEKNTVIYKIIRITLLLLIALVLVGTTLPPFLEQTKDLPNVVLKSGILFVAIFAIGFLYLKHRKKMGEL